MTTLRDKLAATELQPHEFRVVRAIRDDECWTVVAWSDATTYILDQRVTLCDDLEHEVEDLNNYINAHRRVLGMDVDVFARNNIE